MKKADFILLLWMGALITPSAAANVQTTGEAFNRFAIGTSFLLGVITFGYGLYGFYKVSGGNAQRETLSSCILSLISGASLLSIASMYGVWFDTLYGGSSTQTVSTLIAVNPNLMINGASDSFITKHIPKETQAAIIAALKLFGLCAFIKGIYLIKDVGQMDAGQKVGVKKVLSHIIGGMGLVNLPEFSAFVASITGLDYLRIVGG